MFHLPQVKCHLTFIKNSLHVHYRHIKMTNVYLKANRSVAVSVRVSAGVFLLKCVSLCLCECVSVCVCVCVYVYLCFHIYVSMCTLGCIGHRARLKQL